MTTVEPHAVCLDCEVELPDDDAAEKHRTETCAAAEEVDGVRKGHTTRTVHKSPEELARGRVDMAVTDALFQFAEDMEQRIERGEFTPEEVAGGLRRWPDFADYWTGWQESNS